MWRDRSSQRYFVYEVQICMNSTDPCLLIKGNIHMSFNKKWIMDI